MLTDPKTLWYLNRATGLVLLVVFTVVVLLGQYTTRRRAGWTPGFVWLALHRNVTLLGLVLLVVHVVSSVVDDYVDIGPVDAVLPFASPYRTFWLGLGTVAVDLLLAVAISTVLRHRIRYGRWKLLHWLAYLAWPVAVIHGLGTGTDARGRVALLLTAACVAAVGIGGSLRVLAAVRDRRADLAQGPPTLPNLPVLSAGEARWPA